MRNALIEAEGTGRDINDIFEEVGANDRPGGGGGDHEGCRDRG
jgi:hypothetical protein